MDPHPRLASAITRRGVRTAVAALSCWLIYALAYVGNVPSFRDLSCEVYCGPFDIVSATALILALPVLVLATVVLAIITARGSRADRIVGLAGTLLAAVPVGILSWMTFA